MWSWFLIFGLAGVPAFLLRASGANLDAVVTALIFGIGIVGGAFLLSWAAEVAQMDMAASLAIALLALVAILPEYAMEVVLAWDAGSSFDPATGEVTREMQRLAAIVTGSNRLLIGIGWSAVILIYWFRRRRALDLRGHLSLELSVLLVATLLTFLIFFMDQIHIVLAASLIGIYFFYLWSTSRQPTEEPELMGPAAAVGNLPVALRRTIVVVLFVFSASVILVAAEPFVEALVETGAELGVEDFILIQWIAPLASESPEIIIAILFSLRANPAAGLTTLISAEINQLTMLMGSTVFIFSISAGEALSFPLDSRQTAEFLLTSAMSAFAILLIAPRVISWRAGLILLTLFVAHLFFVDPGQRLIFAYIFLGLAAGAAILANQRVREIVRSLVKRGTTGKRG